MRLFIYLKIQWRRFSNVFIDKHPLTLHHWLAQFYNNLAVSIPQVSPFNVEKLQRFKKCPGNR